MTNIEKELLAIQDKLFGYALKLTKDSENAQDLLQETNSKVLNGYKSFIPGTNFRSWTLTIMKNSFINDCRRSRLAANVEEIYCEHYYNGSCSTVYESEYSCCAYDLLQVIDLLPPDCCRAFKLHLLGYKYEEIARKQNVPLGTVKSRINFSRVMLRKSLDEYRC